jgi:predicted 2-oxoglutarate/Fe(II)-dependent dioxygenase YbiX
MEINNSLEKYIKVFNNAMPDDILENLIKICKESTYFQQASIIGEDYKNVLDEKIRKTFSWHMKNIGVKSLTEVHWTNFLYNVFNQSVDNYLKSLNISESYLVNDIQILKYNVGGHYKFHIDNAVNIHRTYSCIFFLNDDYEGGELIFKFPGDNREYKINKQKNSVVVWPSNFLYPHSVTPVIKGERYSVVSWAR